MKKNLLTLMLCLVGLHQSTAQHNNSQIPTSINADGIAPHASAILDVQSTTQGMLVPRMTTVQRSAIANATVGLLVFDTDTGGFWFHDGTGWADLSGGVTVPTNVSAFNNDAGYITSPEDGDADPGNEYNTGVLLNGTSLETTDGGGTISTDLSGLQDKDWLKSDGTQPGSINDGIYTNGKVGIGISSPSYALDIVDTGGPRLRIFSQDGTYAGLLAKNNTREFFIGIQGDFEAADGTNSGFQIYDNTSGARRMVIDYTGNMGIGTSPDAKLHIAGDIKIADGTQGAGKVLTSDADGLASWETLEIPEPEIQYVKDIDNNYYRIVTIGSQTWMAENLRVTRCNDGTAIPLVTDATAWSDLTTGGYTCYENSASDYGALYNWYAVDTTGSCNICPTGWHVPTDAEWTTLIDYLDPGDVDPDVVGAQSTVAGGKMKEAGLAHWNSPNGGATNESGWSGLPGGNRDSNGIFSFLGYVGFWWSASESGGNAWKRSLFFNNGNAYRDNSNKRLGLSVRCLRD